MKVSKTSSWEFNPVKEPDYDNALVLIDTSYFDKKNRLIKSVNYNRKLKEPYIEKYVYSKNKYTYQRIGTARDTIITFKYTKLQKEIDKRNLDYRFSSEDNYKYKIEYY
ncbi:hypothetical protein [Zunongwangia sp. HRR-M8]|uniref:hypothetical protein n=1 Tax=Zunongwangia sp. HRR-M8 TaxID=3015170 RepID=UPI0022DCF547|nr:hypothetical protein [Zunongwangia sp. HRR-M8]WBL23722.1 hypothetical protein PBT89_07120 [Zunongwangia sp. HRR-M8]